MAPPRIRLWTAVLCGYLALGATMQALPEFTSMRFAVSPAMVGALISIAALATAVSRPIAGRGADHGAARRIVLLGAGLGVAGGLGHLWSPSLPMLVIARLMLGAGEGALFTAAVAWVLRYCPPERRGGIAGWFGLSMWGGLAIGPLLAVWLKDSVWYAVIALPLCALALLCTTRQPEIEASATGRTVLLPRQAVRPGLIFGLASYGYGTVAALVILRLKNDGVGGEDVALALFAAAFLGTRTFGSPLVDRWGGAGVGIASSLVEGLGLVLIASSRSLSGALVGVALAGAGVALMYPAMISLVVGRSPPDRQGAAIGLMTSFWDLGVLIAGPIGGLVAEIGGFGPPFAVAGGLAVLASLCILARD